MGIDPKQRRIESRFVRSASARRFESGLRGACPSWDDMVRSRGLGDRLAVPAGELLPHGVPDDLVAPGHLPAKRLRRIRTCLGSAITTCLTRGAITATTEDALPVASTSTISSLASFFAKAPRR